MGPPRAKSSHTMFCDMFIHSNGYYVHYSSLRYLVWFSAALTAQIIIVRKIFLIEKCYSIKVTNFKATYHATANHYIQIKQLLYLASEGREESLALFTENIQNVGRQALASRILKTTSWVNLMTWGGQLVNSEVSYYTYVVQCCSSTEYSYPVCMEKIYRPFSHYGDLAGWQNSPTRTPSWKRG